MTTMTKEQIKAALELIVAIGDVIRELKEVPSGHLYARVMNNLTLEQYESIINQLIRAKLVRKSNHVLYWIG